MSTIKNGASHVETPIEARQGLPHGPLYHYTTTAGAVGILKTKTLWATHLRYLNDSEEFIHGLRLAKDVLQSRSSQETSRAKKIILITAQSVMDMFEDSHIFTTSFSELDDRLSQWRGYSGSSGVSFGFAADHLKTIAENNAYWTLKKCIYQDEEKEAILNGVVDSVVGADLQCEFDDLEVIQPLAHELVLSLYPIAASFKNTAFFEEYEWRMVSVATKAAHGRTSFRTTPTMIIPYQEVPLELKKSGTDKVDIGLVDLKIGPTSNASLLERALSLAADQYKINAPTPARSKAPYRSL